MEKHSVISLDKWKWCEYRPKLLKNRLVSRKIESRIKEKLRPDVYFDMVKRKGDILKYFQLFILLTILIFILTIFQFEDVLPTFPSVTAKAIKDPTNLDDSFPNNCVGKQASNDVIYEYHLNQISTITQALVSSVQIWLHRQMPNFKPKVTTIFLQLTQTKC